VRHFIGIFLICTGVTALGQDLRNILIDERENGKIFSTFLEEIEQRHHVDFIIDLEGIQAYTVNGIEGRQRLLEFLMNTASPTTTDWIFL
jgi:hypothetical protein